MKKLRELILRFGGLFNKRRKDDELADEIAGHIQMHIEDNLRLGMTREEARRQAMIKLGGLESTKEAYREQRGLPLLDTIWQDIRYGARQLRKNPGFTAVAVLTLALGIGANTALFTAIDTIMFRPLPARDPAKLVFVANGRDKDFSFPFYERLRAALTSMEGFSAAQYRAPRRELVLTGADSVAQEISAQGVTGNFFGVLGVPPLLGRTLVEEDDRKGAAEPVVVISHALWVRQFAGDPAVIGRNIRLDNVPVTIIGVMPDGFVGFSADVKPDVWWPLQLVSRLETRQSPLGEGVSWLVLFGRLREGVSHKHAQAEVSVFFRRELEDELARKANRPTAERERILNQKLDLLSGRAGFVGARDEFRQPLFVLMAAVCVVLLIACTNVAGLLLARGAVRHREFAVRTALGAGRQRLVRQLVTESVLLALLGGMAGLIIAFAGTTFLSNFLAQSSTPLPLQPDGRALFFTLAVSLATGAIFGFAPAWRSSRLDLVTAIKDQANAIAGRRGRLQPLLVVAQVALAVLLLAGAGLFARTLQNLRTVDFGFRGENLLSLAIDPGRAPRTPAQQELLLRRLLIELKTAPGVSSVSLGGAGLLTGNGINMDVDVEGYSRAPDEEMRVRTVLAGPDFFGTLGVPLLRGRGFTTADEPPSPRAGEPAHATVAVIGESMARRFFDEADPVGKHFTVDGASKVRLEIVGVAKDTRYSSDLRADIPLQFYIPYFGSGIRMPPTFYLRADQPAALLMASIRQLLNRVDPALKIKTLRSMTEVIDQLLLRERIIAQLVGFFSLFALLLSSLGLYGSLSFRVAQRSREIGVRIALGATLQGVMKLVLRQGLALVLLGGAIGIGAALVATRFVSSLLYGVTPQDPLTFAAVTTVLMAAAALASWLPARRAAKVDPLVALRYE
jgi:macrolide transport system ATP-binding/permease protein